MPPPVRVTTADVPVPFSPPLEQYIEPTTPRDHDSELSEARQRHTATAVRQLLNSRS